MFTPIEVMELDKYQAQVTQNQNVNAAIQLGIDIKHRAMYTGEGMLDQIQCQCGWESRGYWDGSEYAFDDYQRHLAAVR